MSIYSSPRDRFERRRGPPSEMDYYRYQERERDRGRAEVLLDERLDRRGPRGSFQERDFVLEEDRYDAPARRSTFLDEPVPAERLGRALAPYRRPRPQFIRRQSSLDTYDRRPMPRYGDEYRLPADVPIPLPIRRPASPPRQRYFEDYEARYHGPEEDFEEARFRDDRRSEGRERSTVRERSVVRRRRESVSSDSSVESFEEIKKSSIIGKKGRTRMPRRLAHKSALIQLGLPYEEEDDVIIIHRALQKKHIDEIIELSKRYRDSETIHYKFEGEVRIPSESELSVDEEDDVKEEEKVKKVEKKKITKEYRPDGTKKKEKIETEKEVEEEVEEEVKHVREYEVPSFYPPPPPPPPPPAEDDIIRRTVTTTFLDPPDHHHHHQDLAVMTPRNRDEEQIRREIKALELERRSLRSERESVYESERDFEIVERERERRPRDIVRVERDRKVIRERSRPANPKLIGLAMAALT